MSRDPLPDDSDQWPDDPFDLLGVSRSADVATIRRNYAGLIRLWRPEQHPTEFRKIRDAYEAASSFARYWNTSSSDETDEPDDSPSQDTDENRAEEQASHSTPRLLSLEEQLQAAWQLARQGETQAAYDTLLRLQRENEDDGDVSLRLYWLLKISCLLDPQREPLDWLAVSMRATALSGPATELYRRELDRNPKEALSDRCHKLLDLPASAAALSQLAALRWRAAGWLRCHRLIQDDLQRLRPVISSLDDEQWMHTLTAAAEQLAWAADPEALKAFEKCCEEIEDLTHLHTTRSHQFDRLELLRELARSWDQLDAHRRPARYPEGTAGRLEPLVPLWWLGHRDRLRPLLLTAIAQIVAAPGKALGLLKSLETHHSVFVSQIAEMLFWFAHRQDRSDATLAQEDEVRPLVQQWLWPQNGANYSFIRPLLLDFCLQLAVAPETVGEIAEQMNLFHLRDHESFAHQVASDSPLRALFAVCMAF